VRGAETPQVIAIANPVAKAEWKNLREDVVVFIGLRLERRIEFEGENSLNVKHDAITS
jgi:hypothetical protein